MRLGIIEKPPKKGKEKLHLEIKKPKYSSPNLVVGRLSSNLIEYIYRPVLTELATKRLEEYANDQLEYDEIIKEKQKEIKEKKQKEKEATGASDDDDNDESADEAEINVDGTISKNDDDDIILEDLPPLPKRPIWKSEYRIEEFDEHVLQETITYFTTPTTSKSKKRKTKAQEALHIPDNWKMQLKFAKIERQLEEKYGILLPFIKKHPQVEVFVKGIQRKYATGYFSPFRQTESPIGTTTSVIILFMMYRNKVRFDLVCLVASLLLLGLQPWALVLIISFIQIQMNNRKSKCLGSMPKVVKPILSYYYYYYDSSNDDEDDDDVKSDDATAIIENKSSKSNGAEEFEYEEVSDKKKLSYLKRPVGKQVPTDEEIDGTAYDTIIIGSGPSALYTAALLSRSGRKVLVLSGKDDASGCMTFSNNKKNSKLSNLPFDVDSSNVTRLDMIQSKLLSPVLCTTTDLQGGIRFAQVGSDSDGYAYEILAIPGMGTDSIKQTIPFILRSSGGLCTLMDDTATMLGDGWPGTTAISSSDDETLQCNNDIIGHSTAGRYVSDVLTINSTSSNYYMSKVLPESWNGNSADAAYREAAIRHSQPFLDKYFPLNAHVRSLFAGIGMKHENIKPNATSMGAHVSNVASSLSGEGIYYPIGGPRSICHALASVIEQCNNGRIVTGVHVKELLFDESDDKETIAKKGENYAPRCIGVKLIDGRTIELKDKKSSNVTPAVISMDGFIKTFIGYLPESVRTTYKVPRGLPALTEARPVIKICFALKGSAEELSLTGADYYRLPSASLARDEVNYETGDVSLGVIGGRDDFDDDTNEANGDESTTSAHRDKKTKKITENDKKNLTGERKSNDGDDNEVTTADSMKKQQKKTRNFKFDPGASWIQISFPSAKDPSFTSCHGKDVSTCVVTIEASDDFVAFFDTKPKLYAILRDGITDVGQRSRLLERVTKDLLDVYPQLDGKIEHSEVFGPFQRGLSHNPERYAVKGIRAESPYPGLYVGGSDLTIGESFSGSIVGGWLAANAVMGYSAIDHMYLDKNITSDLVRFFDPSGEPDFNEDEEDLAVPTPKEEQQEE